MKNNERIFYKVVFIIVLSLFNVSLFGQAYWDIVTVDPLEICLGDCVEPYSDGDQSVVLMNNDCNNQTIGTGWVSNANPSFTNPCEVAGDGNDVDMLEEITQAGVNTFVTGITVKNNHSKKAHEFAEKYRINILGGTHYSTERFACISMVDYFKKMGLPSEFIEDKPVMEDI